MTKSDGVFFLTPEQELLHRSSATHVKSTDSQFLSPRTLSSRHVSERISNLNTDKFTTLSVDSGDGSQKNDEFQDWFTSPEKFSGTKQHLCNLAKLIANITESYTAAIFLACPTKRTLHVAGVHTLSRDFNIKTEIAFGQGLVGWTAENAVRISVCPFEHDATSLHYYRKNQELKSFIAVPIIGAQKELLGVISCDSKKNYAYAKLTEKILLDCADQAAVLISLTKKASENPTQISPSIHRLSTEFKESLREYTDERSLLNAVANLPEEIIERDAVVVMTTSESGIGAGKFYSSSTEAQVGHRLLETVCKHNKVLCAERTVHVLPSDDNKYRSFVSIPFHVMDTEAGSINILSKPRQAFGAEEVCMMEDVAKIVGHELELIRLRDQLFNNEEASGMISFKHFSLHARKYLADGGAFTLIRMSIGCLEEIEDIAGAEAATLVFRRLLRLTSQVVRSPSLVGHLYGTQILVLAETREAHRILPRLQHLIDRLNLSDISDQHIPEQRVAKQPFSTQGLASNRKLNTKKINDVIANGIFIATAQYKKHGGTFQELMAFTRKTLEENVGKIQAEKSGSRKLAVNAGSW